MLNASASDDVDHDVRKFGIVCSASPAADLALGLGLKRDFEQRVYTVADVEHIAPLFAFAVNGQVLALQRKPNKD